MFGGSCSFRPGALCGMRTRRARGMSLVERVGGLISAIGPGSGMGDDWGHGVDTGPGGCGFVKGRSWGIGVDLTGGGRPGCVRSDGDLLGGWQSSRVAWNHHDGRARDDRCVFPEELSVAKGDTTRTIHLHNVLVELSDLNDHACLVPFSRVGSSLVLDPYRTVSPTASGGRTRVCSDSRSAARICRFLSASSRDMRVSRQVVWGWYLHG